MKYYRYVCDECSKEEGESWMVIPCVMKLQGELHFCSEECKEAYLDRKLADEAELRAVLIK